MKRSRKILAILLAMTMVFSFSMTAMASAGAPNEVGQNGSATGDGKIITGDFDDEMLRCWVPTQLAFDFILDPKGLKDLNVGDLFDPFDDTRTNGIYFDSTAIFHIVSESSVDLAVDVEFKAIDTGGEIRFWDQASIGSFDTPSSSPYANGSLYTNDVSIYFTLATNQIEDTSSLFDTVGQFAGGTVDVSLDNTGSLDLSFVLDKIDYQYEVTSVYDGDYLGIYADDYTFVKKVANAGSGTQIIPNGEIGFWGSWAGYFGNAPANTLELTSKFIFAAHDEDPLNPTTPVTGAYGYVEETHLAGDAAIVYTWSALGGAATVSATNAATSIAISELTGAATLTGVDLYYSSGGNTPVALTVVNTSVSANNQIRNLNGLLIMRLGPLTAVEWTKVVLKLSDGTEITVNK